MEKVKNKVFDFWNETKYEICIFIYLYIRMILMLPKNFISWCSTYYGINYSYGFIPRGLIGTIFDFVFDGDISFINAHSFVFIFQYILIVLVSYLLGKFIRIVQDEKRRKQVIFFVGVYLIMPFSIIYLFDRENYGRLDLYLYIITILQILLIFNKTTLMRLIWIGILSTICVAIHEAYALYIFPILMLVLTYKLYKSNFDKKILLGIAIIMLMTFIATVYFNFYATINISNSAELFNDINSKTDLRIKKRVLEYEYYKHNISEQMNYFARKELLRNIVGAIVTAVFLLPLNIVLYRLTKKFFKTPNEKIYKYTFMFAQVLILIYLPLYITTSDWGRWLAAMYTFQIVILSLLIYENEKSIFEFFDKIKEKIKGWEFTASMYLLLVMSLGPMQHAGIFSYVATYILGICNIAPYKYMLIE